MLNAKYGLDQPVYVQFGKYVSNMVQGDFGVSYNISKNTPISQLIQTRLPVSIRIGGMAVGLGAIVGLIFGVIAALNHNTFWDTLCTAVSVLGVSVPSYVFALALSYTFGFRLSWLPMLYSSKAEFASSVMPSIALGMFTMASIARFTRTEMLEVLGSDYMLLAESKGITAIGTGTDRAAVTAIQSNDYNVVISLSFIYSAMYIGIMLVVDLLYGLIDPRIRITKEGGNA